MAVKGVYEMTADSGWKTLPLASGISAYSDAQLPQYRKIGEVVYLRGAVKGVDANETVVATLPTGHRPTQTHSYVQNGTVYGTQAIVTRMIVRINGDIVVQYDSATIDSYNHEWYPINTEFLVN